MPIVTPNFSKILPTEHIKGHRGVALSGFYSTPGFILKCNSKATCFSCGFLSGSLCLVSPLLPQSVWKDSQDLCVQQLRLLQPRQLLSQFHLQTVTSAIFPFQMLDAADAPGGRRGASTCDGARLRKQAGVWAGQPELARNHDGHTITHGLGLLHVVGG